MGDVPPGVRIVRDAARRVRAVPLLALCMGVALAGCGPATDASDDGDTRAGAAGTTALPAQPEAGRSGLPAKPRSTGRQPGSARRAAFASTAPGTPAVVAKVVDGDTIELRNGRKVRLVQVDTPEKYGSAECYGREASDTLARLLQPGTRVRLERDPALDDVDDYGRLLRYVHAGRVNVNVRLVTVGAASVWFYDGERGRYAGLLHERARRAKAQGAGLWGACPDAVLDVTRGVDTGKRAGSGGGSGSPPAGSSGASSGASGGNPGLPTPPRYPPDVDCSDLDGPVWVGADDLHRLDRDGDGIGCDG